MTEREEMAYLEVLHNFRKTVDIIDDKMANTTSLKIKDVKQLLLEISDAYILLLTE